MFSRSACLLTLLVWFGEMMFQQASACADPPELVVDGVSLSESIQQMKDKSSSSRWLAAWKIGKIGLRADLAVPVLLEALQDQEADVRSVACDALCEFSSQAGKAVPILIKQVKTRDNVSGALKLLRAIGPEASPAVPALIELLKDSKADSLLAIVEILDELKSGINEATPILLNRLQKSKDKSDRTVLAALARLRAEPKIVVPIIQKMLKEQDGREMIFSLAFYGADAQHVVPDLIPLFKSPDFQDRIQVAEVLGRIGHGSKEAAAALQGRSGG